MSVRVELWELPGPHWRLPIRVVWFAELAEVRVGAGVRLPACMVKVAEEKLSTVGKRIGTNFWLSQESLGKIAKPSQSEDPEEVIEWFPDRAPKKVKSTYRARDFIMAYCSEPYAMVKDPLIAEPIYFSFCRFMLHWLVNEGKEVDLIFAKLNALLFRSNWQSIAAGIDNGWKDASPQNIVDRGMAEKFLTHHVTAWNPENKLARSTLDCRTTEEWDRFSQLVERARKKRCSGWTYQVSIRTRLKRQILKAIESYAQFLREANYPHVVIPRFDPKGIGTQSFPFEKRMDVVEAADPRWPSAGVPETEEQGAEGNLEASDAGVHEVSDLQSEE